MLTLTKRFCYPTTKCQITTNRVLSVFKNHLRCHLLSSILCKYSMYIAMLLQGSNSLCFIVCTFSFIFHLILVSFISFVLYFISCVCYKLIIRQPALMALLAFWQPALSLISKCRIVMIITRQIKCLLAYKIFSTVLARASPRVTKRPKGR